MSRGAALSKAPAFVTLMLSATAKVSAAPLMPILSSPSTSPTNGTSTAFAVPSPLPSSLRAHSLATTSPQRLVRCCARPRPDFGQYSNGPARRDTGANAIVECLALKFNYSSSSARVRACGLSGQSSRGSFCAGHAPFCSSAATPLPAITLYALRCRTAQKRFQFFSFKVLCWRNQPMLGGSSADLNQPLASLDGSVPSFKIAGARRRSPHTRGLSRPGSGTRLLRGGGRDDVSGIHSRAWRCVHSRCSDP